MASMSFYQSQDGQRPFQRTLAPFLGGEGLPFADVLSADQVEQACADAQVSFGRSPRALYNPALILWAFLSQVLSKDGSCRAAVARILVVVALERGPIDLDTAGYCRARAKLPIALLRQLAVDTAQRLEAAVPARWR